MPSTKTLPRGTAHEHDDRGDHGDGGDADVDRVVRREVADREQRLRRRRELVFLAGVDRAELRQDEREQRRDRGDREHHHHDRIRQRGLQLLLHLVVALEHLADAAQHAFEIAAGLAGADEVDRIGREYLRMAAERERELLAAFDLRLQFLQDFPQTQTVALARDAIQCHDQRHVGADHDRQLGEEEQDVAVADAAGCGADFGAELDFALRLRQQHRAFAVLGQPPNLRLQ